MKPTKLAEQVIQHARQYLALGDKVNAVSMLRASAQAKLNEADMLLQDQRKALYGSSRVRSLGRLCALAKSDAYWLSSTADQIEKYGKVI